MGDLIGELLLGFFSLAVGLALGSLVFLLVRVGRWVLLRSERATTVLDPRMRSWSVRIPLAPTPMRFWASKQMLRMRAKDRRTREISGASPDAVVDSELAHPGALVDRTEEAASIVAAALLVVVVLSLLVLAVEAVVVVVVAVVVAVLRLVWGRWHCEVVAPDGRRTRITTRSLSEARARKDAICKSIERRGTCEQVGCSAAMD